MITENKKHREVNVIGTGDTDRFQYHEVPGPGSNGRSACAGCRDVPECTGGDVIHRS